MSSSNTDFDAKLVDWLYGELDSDDAASFEAHLEAHPEHRAEANALRDTRLAFKGLPLAEPPTALTSMLMQQAAASVQPKEGVWSAIVAFFQPVILHPAASAMATIVLMAGVAGTLYMRNGNMVAEPESASSRAEQPALLPNAALPSAALPPAPLSETSTVAALEKAKDELDEEAEPVSDQEAAEGYAADIASPAQEELLRAAVSKDGETRSDNKRAKEDKAIAQGIGDADDFAFKSNLATNAVSGGALAPGAKTLELGKSSSSTGNRGTVGGVVSPSPSRARTAPKTVQKPTKKAKNKNVDSWEDQQVQSFQAAARKKRCRDAGRIANDLREKSPRAYDRNVKGSPEESDCSYYIASETKRRSVARAKRASKKKARAGQGKSVPTNAVAAPQKDELAEPAQVQEASPAL